MSESAQPIRIGVIGTGGIARDYLVPALKQVSGAQLWSVCSRDRSKAEQFVAEVGATAPVLSFSNMEEFLSDKDLDAVIIATPDKLHVSQAIAAAEASKHLFVEKPLATCHSDASAIVAACRSRNLQLAVGYHLRWHAGHRLLAGRIAGGDLGTIHHARVQWTLKPPVNDWRRDAELGKWWSLGAVGTHGLDLLQWMLRPVCGDIVQVVSLCAADHDGKRGDATSIVNLQFASGATAEVLSSVLFKVPRLIEIHGHKSSATCRDTLGPHGAGTILLNEEKLDFKVTNPYQMELQDFIRSILTGQPPESDGENGMFNVDLLERATP